MKFIGKIVKHQNTFVHCVLNANLSSGTITLTWFQFYFEFPVWLSTLCSVQKSVKAQIKVSLITLLHIEISTENWMTLKKMTTFRTVNGWIIIYALDDFN
jgi:hypothetical protein